MRTVYALLAVVCFALPAAGQGRYQDFGDATGFLNILPPGQDGSLNGVEAVQAATGTYPPHVIDQLGMYGDLVYATPGLAESQLLDYFKDASFGVRDDDIARTYSPTPGVTVVRDAGFGVPHIYGTTRYATMFAQGYTAAEDRLFLMDVLRHTGRARLSEFLGGAASNQHMDRDQLALAPYQEADLTAQIEAIRTAGAEGQAAYDDLVAYRDGVNQYINEALGDVTKLPAEYPALQQVPQPWKLEDAVAIASLVGGIFGKGGGGELRNHCALQQMTATLGSASTARAIFDDLRFANDAEAPTTSSASFPYPVTGTPNPAAHPDVDCATLQPIDPTGPPLMQLLDVIAGLGQALGLPRAMSNAMLIGREHTDTGAPIAVFGPQTSYYMPQLLIEKDVHGPGIDARGAAFAGTDLWVQLGRGRDYAWSATSAGADNIDQFVLRLCEPGGGTPTPDSLGYLRNGVCQPIERWNHVQIAKPTAGGIPTVGETGGMCANADDDEGDGFVNDGCPQVGLLPELLLQCLNDTDDDGDGAVNDGCPPIVGPDLVLSWRAERTAHYGPLVARGRLTDGTPIAVATLRTTYRNELGSAIGFRRVNDPDFMANGFASFRQAMGAGVDYTFNWFYIDARDIGYQHSCRCPRRANGVDPALPAWGNGLFDWQGTIGLADQPWELNPAKGWLTSWNNKQAPDFQANDANYSYGPLYRSLLFDRRVEAAIAAGPVTRAKAVDAMEEAGTIDLRAQEVLPLLLEVLGTTAPGGTDPRAQDMRDRLAAWDGHRRDHDASGAYDDPQSPAIIDAWWPRLSHAIFDGPSGSALGALGLTIDDPNRRNHIGSAFQDGTYGQVHKDLRRVLGRPGPSPFSRAYCGNGDLAACRALLWESLSDAASDLEAEFGSASVADWQRQIADEAVEHTAAGITSVPAIHWINRPTFQQVVQLPAKRVVDHYRCYKARAGIRFPGATLPVADAFGTTQTFVQRLDSFCLPVAVNGDPIADPRAHLACYRTKPVAGQPRFARQSATFEDPFGTRSLTLVKPRTVCVPAERDGAASALLLDAFACYKAGQPDPRFSRRTAAVADAYESKTSVVLKPQTVCAPAGLAGEPVGNGATFLTCYKAKDAAGQPKFAPRSLTFADRFGTWPATATKPGLLCVKSERP